MKEKLLSILHSVGVIAAGYVQIAATTLSAIYTTLQIFKLTREFFPKKKKN